MSATTKPLLRSLEFERGTTEQACKGVVDPSEIIAKAEFRAQQLSGEYVHDPMWIQPGRDRRREAREEALDFRNHILWDCLEHIEDEDRCLENVRALGKVCEAYELIKDRD